MDHRRHQAEFRSAFADSNFEDDLVDELLFPYQHNIAARHLTGVSLLTAELCDLNTTSGLALATMDLDPLLTAHFSQLDGRHRRD
jgi:hypothetical protein